MSNSNNIGLVVSDVIQDMDLTDMVCIKNRSTGTGFESSVASLNQCLYPVVETHENSRGGYTISIANEHWLVMARQRGYKV